MRKIKRNIRERMMWVAFKVIWRLEESIGNVSGNLVSNYDMDKFFVRNFTRVVVAVEWVVIEMRRWLDLRKLNKKLKEHKDIDIDDLLGF